MRFRKTIIVAGTVASLTAFAAPAFASGNPVAVTATVNQTISMTGPPASLALQGDPGTTATGDVAYTVTTNDGNGYVVTVTPTNSWLSSGPNQISNSNMAYVANGNGQLNFSGGPITPVNKSSVSGASGDSYTDTFKLNIPGNAPAGNYSESFTYLATAK